MNIDGERMRCAGHCGGGGEFEQTAPSHTQKIKHCLRQMTSDPDFESSDGLPSESDPDRHFRTDHLQADLKGRSVHGGVITIASQGFRFALTIVSTMILARLLTPAEYGLVAMVAVFSGFVALFKDMGLSMATIQRAEINHAQISTLFWINLAISLLIGLLVALLV